MSSQDVSCQAVRPLFDYVRMSGGPAAPEELRSVAQVPYSLAFLVDTAHWIRFEDWLSLLSNLADIAREPDAAFRAGQTTAEMAYDGSVMPHAGAPLVPCMEQVIDLINRDICRATRLSPVIVRQGHVALRLQYCDSHARSRLFGRFLLGFLSKIMERRGPCRPETSVLEAPAKSECSYQLLNLDWRAPKRLHREIALMSAAGGGLAFGAALLLRSTGKPRAGLGLAALLGTALGACLGYQMQTGGYVRGLLKTSEEQNELLLEQTHILEETIAKNRKITSQAIEALAQAIEAKDPYTCGHSRRVAEYSSVLAKAMDLSPGKQDVLLTGALLHDIGKIGVPDSILLKEGKLTPPEFQLVKQHTVIGYDMLLGMEFLDDALGIVRFHHERWDGCGYPSGLAGNEIPQLARIVGLADAFDAMTSNRTYRRRLNFPQIRAQIQEGRGSQFAPEVVDAFFAHEDFFAPMAP